MKLTVLIINAANRCIHYAKCLFHYALILLGTTNNLVTIAGKKVHFYRHCRGYFLASMRLLTWWEQVCLFAKSTKPWNVIIQFDIEGILAEGTECERLTWIMDDGRKQIFEQMLKEMSAVDSIMILEYPNGVDINVLNITRPIK